jgi:HD-GYP domain-containing protein (c-di-GMP phosphodiesterase class II)
VGAHHERWDGDGYPHGLRGEAIPLASRVISVCDAFEAMVSRRPYRAPLTVEMAMRELLDAAGSQFDPEVVAAVEVEIGAGA